MRTWYSFLAGIVVTSHFFVIGAFGDLNSELRSKRIQDASKFSVKIETRLANVFSPQIRGSSGTGFVIEMGERILICTNAHVINRNNPFEARKIMVKVSQGEAVPISAPAKLEYISAIHDVAFLSIERDALGDYPIIEADLATEEEMQAIIKGNSEVMAYGFPLGLSNVSSSGQISSQHVDFVRGVFIQTQAPINPGNSGGPLVHIESGKVVGINTSKVTSGDNIGFATPITVAMAEYEHFKTIANYGAKKGLRATLNLHKGDSLKRSGVASMLNSLTQTDYLKQYLGAISVADAASMTGLKPNDYIIKVKDEPIGMRLYRFMELVQRCQTSTLPVTVLRGGKLKEIELSFDTAAHGAEVNDEIKFVYLGGLFIREVHDARAWSILSEGSSSRLMVEFVFPNSEAHSFAQISMRSIIEGVTVAGIYTRTDTLEQLKEALKLWESTDPQAIHIHYFSGLKADGGPIADSNTNEVLVSRHRSTSFLQVAQYFSDDHFSISTMQEGFSFNGTVPQANDWRLQVGNTNCGKELLVQAGLIGQNHI